MEKNYSGYIKSFESACGNGATVVIAGVEELLIVTSGDTWQKALDEVVISANVLAAYKESKEVSEISYLPYGIDTDKFMLKRVK